MERRTSDQGQLFDGEVVMEMRSRGHGEANISQELKPVDGGRDAWQLLIAAFIFEALFWGFPTSFGVFQNYYSTVPQFKDKTTSIPLIGTVAQALAYLGAPLSAALTKRFPRYQKHQILFGWALCIGGLLCGSFTDSVPGLIGTQGIMYGAGFIILTYPPINFINEWWIARKGMAFGLISAASGLAGIVMPFIVEAMLNRYGYRTTLRASAVAMAVLTTPLIPLLRGRLPQSEQAMQPKTDWSFIKKPLFWVYGTAMIVQGLGFFITPVFIPSYATSVGLSASQGALLLAIMSAFQVLGQFVFGWLSDRSVPTSLLSSTCAIAAAVATATCWGLGKSLALLIMFSVLYGFFGFGFGTLRVAMGRAVSTEQSAVLATYSTLVFLQGIGIVLVGPISAALMSPAVIPEIYGVGRYKDLIIFVAASSMLGGVIIISRHVPTLLANMIK